MNNFGRFLYIQFHFNKWIENASDDDENDNDDDLNLGQKCVLINLWCSTSYHVSANRKLNCIESKNKIKWMAIMETNAFAFDDSTLFTQWKFIK